MSVVGELEATVGLPNVAGVGPKLGAEVRLLEGTVEGKDGGLEGFRVGNPDFASVGRLEGELVVGTALGMPDGVAVGISELAMEGMALGMPDGVIVGVADAW